MKIGIDIEITSAQERVLKSIKFDSEGGIIEKEKDENIILQLVNLGIFQYVVTSWGYEEHKICLSNIGEQVIRRYFKNITL